VLSSSSLTRDGEFWGDKEGSEAGNGSTGDDELVTVFSAPGDEVGDKCGKIGGELSL